MHNTTTRFAIYTRRAPKIWVQRSRRLHRHDRRAPRRLSLKSHEWNNDETKCDAKQKEGETTPAPQQVPDEPARLLIL